ncbi:uncharacterized protein LOC131675078 [Phymastichus coffea]|uniref:uncharacterized protein LOC131675078 n=1 Tax=Phymastichus coffea TaxID=108790 RepID=UPI00273C7EEE|nr:uncharacterized protein LOC131675078 [Phymastichus coffea]XP_058809907.1 uncharacterized protein LOC131675078 [Phymastichus coffea]
MYTKRHKRRLVQNRTEKNMEVIKKFIKKCVDNRNDYSNVADTQSSTTQIQEKTDEVYLISNEIIDPIKNSNETLTSNFHTKILGCETIADKFTNDEWYDCIDEDIIMKDTEFEYRYSDCEDSGYSDCESSDVCEADDPSSSVNYKFNVTNTLSDNNSKSENIGNVSDQLKTLLPEWVIDNNITQTAFTDLLHRLRRDVPSLKLPLDSRTLLKTPEHTEIYKINGGEYCHFGLSSCLEKIALDRRLLKIEQKTIDLLINVDGAPMGKSTAKTLWPILCSDKLGKNVYIVGIFNGCSKPEDSDEFLKFFIEEAKNFVNNGITILKTHYNVIIDGIICDAPAKAYILGVKCHSGYSSCTKCEIVGQMKKCVCFPGGISTLREDAKFNEFAYSDEDKKKIIN